MTGNNKFWRASLAGLASVAMLATMGVAASTANADDAAKVGDYDYTVTLHANSPAGVSAASVSAQASVTSDGKAQSGDAVTLDGYTLDVADGNAADSKLEGLYDSAAGWNVFNPNGNDLAWKFTGWYTSPDAGAEKFDFNSATVTKDIDLYAHWAEPDQAITLDFTDPSGVFDNSKTVYSGASKAAFASFTGSGYQLTVAKTDKKIASWELPADKAGDQKVVTTWKNDSESLTLNELTKDFTGKLQGVYDKAITLAPVVPTSANAVTVRYYENTSNPREIADAVDVPYGATVPTSPVVSGYFNISKWAYVDPITGKLVEVKDGFTASEAFTAGLNLYAAAAAETFKVTFVTEVSGKDVVVSTEYVAKGEAPKGPTAPTRNNDYTFAGWSTTPGVNQTTVALSSLKISKDTTLYAQWNTNKANVKFDYNYAGKYDGQSYAAGQTFTAPTPTRAGYEFLGWYYAAGSNGSAYANGNPFGYELDHADGNYYYFVKAYLPGKHSVTKEVGWVSQRNSDKDTTATSNAKWLKKYNKYITDYYADKTAIEVPANAKLQITSGGELQYLNVKTTTNADGTHTESTWVTIPNTLYAAWGKINAADLDNSEQQVPSQDEDGNFPAESADFTADSYAAYAAAMKEYNALKAQYGKTPTDEQVSELSAKLDAAKALLQETTSTPVYRLYNPYTGDHLYTTDTKEYSDLQKIGWKGESEQFKVLSADKYGLSTAVYRVYNPYTDEHLLTTDTAEVANLVKAGWLEDFDGQPAFYAPQGGNVDVTRLFNPYATVGTHLYSTDQKEIDMNVKLGWVKDNPAVIFSTR
ncbi:InlB B-repeat-containing protein [Bifidobacterium vespertilionis]|uniref:DUF5648 domain-containing protein n=1 Tax=Bifidobacterium vespertilionis TaxID=2562524 RepID=A0A5J5DWP4_9BIFI|nr:InlB B-repeat-containing protein [Bifidobacterium vespertilionis]KAA8821173.1 hypothetical protein EMO90_05160 [Bifidobacterium vespertilionis]KAA8821456.1 hypothetical protein EM848_10885 [Bifidobacterium vespertilionis]